MPRLPLVLLAGLVAAGLVLLGFTLLGDDEPPSYGPVQLDSGKPDPFALTPAREAEFVERAKAGHSHVLYEKSPGGAVASARRVAAWRAQVERAAGKAGVDPDTLEGMVLLESAGDPNARAGDDLEGAVGLTQILAATATSLLGMRVDVEESERLTRRIRRVEERGERAKGRRLRDLRKTVDERFDPVKALAGAGRYLEIALERYGREDLAVVSYHMGMGNLDGVLEAYGEKDAGWARVFFDASPDHNPEVYAKLAGFGDDSSTYLWRVYAAREIMRLHRTDPAALRRLAGLQSSKASAEEVLHPRSQTKVYENAEALEDGYQGRELRPFPQDPGRLGLRRSPRMGELAKRLEVERRLYRGLRPEAFAMSVYIAAGVRGLSGAKAPLTVTSTVRDGGYQRLLAERNFQATRAYSLHTTGFAFDVRRSYASRRQAVAFQYMLDRMQSLNLIAWVREPDAIHITVSSEARRLLPLLRPGDSQ